MMVYSIFNQKLFMIENGIFSEAIIINSMSKLSRKSRNYEGIRGMGGIRVKFWLRDGSEYSNEIS